MVKRQGPVLAGQMSEVGNRQFQTALIELEIHAG